MSWLLPPFSTCLALEGRAQVVVWKTEGGYQNLQLRLSSSPWLTSMGHGPFWNPTGHSQVHKELFICSGYLPTEAPGAVSVDAGIAQALVHLWVAAGVMGPLGAQTAETIHIVDARCTLSTGIGGTLINVNVTSLPCRGGKHFFLVKSKIFRE